MHEHTQNSAIAAAAEQAEKIRRAVSHLGKAVELGLIDVALDPQTLTEEVRRRYARLGEAILDISAMSQELLSDIAKTTGLELRSDTIEAPIIEEIDPPLRQAIDETAIELPVAEGATQTDPVEEAGSTPVSTPEVSRLYHEIVSLADAPAAPRTRDANTFQAQIVAARHIQFARGNLWLDGRELYIFNALLRGRDRFRSSQVLRGDEFELGRSNTEANLRQLFRVALNRLTTRCENAAGEPIVLKIGERSKTQYMLNPNLELIDERPVVSQQQVPSPEIVKKN